jgi:hypothetical protein
MIFLLKNNKNLCFKLKFKKNFLIQKNVKLKIKF